MTDHQRTQSKSDVSRIPHLSEQSEPEHQQKSGDLNLHGTEFSDPISPQILPDRVRAMQSMFGNHETQRLLARMPQPAAKADMTFGGLITPSPSVIQRKPPSNVEEAMSISKQASGTFATTKPKQSDDVFSSLRIKANEAFDDLKSVTDKIAGQTGGKASYRSKLKGMDRSWDKIVNKYKSNAAGLIDIIASKIVYDDFKGVYAALDMLVNNSPIDVVYFQDRFLTPVASGYSDIIMSVKLPNGHIGELRLHLASVDAIFEKEHKLYEIIRSKGMDALTEDQKREYQQLKGDYESAREDAYKSLG